jgi:hypothetical protein
VGWSVEDRLGRALLDDASEVHDEHALADHAHNIKIMRDEQHREPGVAPQFVKEFQDRRLNGNIERRGRLVEDEKLRFEGDGARVRRTLCLTGVQGSATG